MVLFANMYRQHLTGCAIESPDWGMGKGCIGMPRINTPRHAACGTGGGFPESCPWATLLEALPAGRRYCSAPAQVTTDQMCNTPALICAREMPRLVHAPRQDQGWWPRTKGTT